MHTYKRVYVISQVEGMTALSAEIKVVRSITAGTKAEPERIQYKH